MRDEVMKVISELAPVLKGDGGELELKEITDDGTVTICMTGLCGSCNAMLWTHRLRIERAIHKKLPNAKVIVKA